MFNFIAMLFLAGGTGVVGLEDVNELVEQAQQSYDKDMKALVQNYKDSVNQTREKYVEERKKISSEMTETLEAIRDQASKDVDLETANDAQEAIKAAKNDDHEPPKVEVGPKKKRKDYTGTWEGQWDNSNALKFTVTEDNTVYHHLNEDNKIRARLTIKDGRSLVLGGKWQDFEFIRKGNRMIVLGWSKSGNRHPMLNQPDHVAILFKKD